MLSFFLGCILLSTGIVHCSRPKYCCFPCSTRPVSLVGIKPFHLLCKTLGSKVALTFFLFKRANDNVMPFPYFTFSLVIFKQNRKPYNIAI